MPIIITATPDIVCDYGLYFQKQKAFTMGPVEWFKKYHPECLSGGSDEEEETIPECDCGKPATEKIAVGGTDAGDVFETWCKDCVDEDKECGFSVVIGKEDDEDDSDDEDDPFCFEPIYATVDGVNELCGDAPNLQMFKTSGSGRHRTKTIYYQTGGGGPECGYFVRYYTKIDKRFRLEVVRSESVYSVERTWGTSFKPTKLDGNLVITKLDGKRHCVFVKKEDEERFRKLYVVHEKY